jgi:hypothetical protein
MSTGDAAWYAKHKDTYAASQRLLMHEAEARLRSLPVGSSERSLRGAEGRTNYAHPRKRNPPMELQPLDAEYEPQPCVKCHHFGRYGSKGEAEGINHGRVVYRCTRCRVLFFSPRQYVRPGVENGL